MCGARHVGGGRRCACYVSRLRNVVFGTHSDGEQGSKVSNLKRELAEEQEAAHERLAKRMKLDRAPVFKECA